MEVESHFISKKLAQKPNTKNAKASRGEIKNKTVLHSQVKLRLRWLSIVKFPSGKSRTPFENAAV